MWCPQDITPCILPQKPLCSYLERWVEAESETLGNLEDDVESARVCISDSPWLSLPRIHDYGLYPLKLYVRSIDCPANPVLTIYMSELVLSNSAYDKIRLLSFTRLPRPGLTSGLLSFSDLNKLTSFGRTSRHDLHNISQMAPSTLCGYRANWHVSESWPSP